MSGRHCMATIPKNYFISTTYQKRTQEFFGQDLRLDLS